jgi:hypothetical protein
MTELSTTDAPPDSATDALVERLFMATIDTLEIASVHVSGRLGFYRALADGGPATPGELAARTGTTRALRARMARATGRRRVPVGLTTWTPRPVNADTGCPPTTAPSSSTRRT